MQAKHSQSELEASNIQMEELRSSNRRATDSLSDAVAENKRLQIDLQQGYTSSTAYTLDLLCLRFILHAHT